MEKGQEYEKTKLESYAEKWLKEHGYEFKLIKQYISKTKYEVKKGGITEIFELSNVVTDPPLYMNLFEKSFEMKLQLESIKKQNKAT